MHIVRTGRVLLATALLGVPLLIVCTANGRVDDNHGALQRGRATVVYPFRDELTRCRDLGFAANADAACQALWARVRDRFVGYAGRASGATRRAGASVGHDGGATR
jgi:conjugative transfer region protein TrbK